MNMKRNLFLTILSLLLIFSLNSFQKSDSFIVVIDAAHGGKDTGSSFDDFTEAQFTLDLSNILSTKEKDPNIKFIFTRSSDEFKELRERADFANHHKADLFVSLHCNQSENLDVSGIELYFPEEGDYIESSELFCENLNSQFIDNQLTMSTRSIKPGKFFVTSRTECPSVILELGFISNTIDRKIMQDPIEIDKIATSIIKCIETQYAIAQRN